MPLADNFEVAYVAPAVRSLETDALVVLPVEGEFPQEFHLLDAVQKVLAVFRILNGIPDLDHCAVASVPEVAGCLRNSVCKVKVNFCVVDYRLLRLLQKSLIQFQIKSLV